MSVPQASAPRCGNLLGIGFAWCYIGLASGAAAKLHVKEISVFPLSTSSGVNGSSQSCPFHSFLLALRNWQMNWSQSPPQLAAQQNASTMLPPGSICRMRWQQLSPGVHSRHEVHVHHGPVDTPIPAMCASWCRLVEFSMYFE